MLNYCWVFVYARHNIIEFFFVVLMSREQRKKKKMRDDFLCDHVEVCTVFGFHMRRDFYITLNGFGYIIRGLVSTMDPQRDRDNETLCGPSL